jgi:hypothetical protein
VSEPRNVRYALSDLDPCPECGATAEGDAALLGCGECPTTIGCFACGWMGELNHSEHRPPKERSAP